MCAGFEGWHGVEPDVRLTGPLSVDLDFNYIGQEARADMQADRPEVERAIVIIGEGQGYRVQQSIDAHAGRKVYLSYTSSHPLYQYGQDRFERVTDRSIEVRNSLYPCCIVMSSQ